MTSQDSPYLPVPPELAANGSLITIKQAAKAHGAFEGTLKANAKAGRLKAFQAHFGAPVMVLNSDVEAFLKSRPDIASNHHPKASPAAPTAGHLPATEKRKTSDDLHLPVQIHPHAPVGDFGIPITLRSLSNTLPSERGLVAACLSEIARQINETIPSNAGNHPDQ